MSEATRTIAAIGDLGGPRAHGRREMQMERKRTSATRATCVVALVLTALFLAGSLDAQETRGWI
jgi:hypothetical protein